MKEMEKNYSSKECESRIYKDWMEKGYFHDEADDSKEPFCIVMPPPNITGQLHMGHALDNAIQDTLTRFKRMQGYCTLWLPGSDHASIATEVKIVQQLEKEGLSKEKLGREKYLERAWQWRDEYGRRIVEQLKRLGSSCDWQRERFTMDEGCSKAVREVFVNLYEKDMIYQGSRIINWCPVCQTALSEAEVEYEEKSSHLWHLSYPLTDGSGSIIVATTRPETMLGDSAVAVNPNDDRYKDMIGKTIMLPLMDREIPIIGDDYVSMEFGSGAVKITPAHDPNDYNMAQRHDIEIINIMNTDGSMNGNAGIYATLSSKEARKKVVADLDSINLLVKIEDYGHNVGTCYRCHTSIEPLISKQWFCRMDELAKPAIDGVNNKEVKFVPERFSKTYFNWMDNIHDWCISRQLWWGHRIPVWYCQDCEEMIVGREDPTSCNKCGSTNIIQDEDVLDTWFSSALWPFSTLGWPTMTKDLEYFYPTNILVTGYDIIFFWVARMVFSGYEQMEQKPFEHVLIHGLVRDSQGRKMSKSLGNGIDPLDIIDEYGADALRFSLISGNSPGNDMRFNDSKIQSARNFANKIWNASRFVLMNIGDTKPLSIGEVELDISDKWIISELNRVTKEVTANIESFELGIALQKIYDFIWSQFCDWYIEFSKSRLYSDNDDMKISTHAVLYYVLVESLKMLHPFMPFITEEIYQHMPGCEGSIMVQKLGVYDEKYNFTTEQKAMECVKEIIRSIRNVRAELDVPVGKKTRILLMDKKNIALKECSNYVKRQAMGSSIEFIDADIDDDSMAAIVCEAANVYLPMNELVDTQKEIARLEKTLLQTQNTISRANGMLNNERFILKAPAKVIEKEKLALSKAIEKQTELEAMLNKLKAE